MCPAGRSLWRTLSPAPSATFPSSGLDESATDAIGILTITPSEGVIIAADIATKAADVQIGFLDRFGGSLLLTGDVASVEAGLREVLRYFGDVLHYALTDCTRS